MTPPDPDSTEARHHSDGGDPQRRRNNNKRRRNNNNNNRNRRSKNFVKGRTRGGKNGRRPNNDQEDFTERRPPEYVGDPFETEGLLEIAPKGFGFLRIAKRDFEQARIDVYVGHDQIRNNGLRQGSWITGMARDSNRGQQLVEIKTVNGLPVDEAKKLPSFDELKAYNPDKRLAFETTPDRHTTRILDIVAPVGRGQRGLIVSPPRSGKTTMLLHIAEAVQELHEEHLHLMVLLVDERPEEVTEFKRQLPDTEIYASSNDQGNRNHCRLAELCIDRAKRLMESGKHVFILMDSITRLARAYNNSPTGGGRGKGYQSGGIVAGALEMPRRLFAAARNTKDAGSITILATALIQTNSRADEAIFQEFKGTGNMELVLDRKIAEQYIYPAVDIFKSGTRREELILPDHTLHKIHLIRRGLSGHKPTEAMERMLYFLKKTPNNAQLLLDIKG
nr:transcription termination factor Rho-like [Nerophis lumbriciformis]